MINNNLAERLFAFESGDLSETDTVQLFQELVNTGLAWQLQGFYGRTAMAMIHDGLITDPRPGE